MVNNGPGYILRINSDEWVEQVFQLSKYYPGLIRKWRKGTHILLARKSDEGDSFLGYGVVDKVEMPWELTPEEEDYCRENNWKCVLTLKPLIRFKRPFPLKDTILADDKRKGSYLHGALLREEQLENILGSFESI